MLHDNREGLQYYFTLRASPMRSAILLEIDLRESSEQEIS